jgi:hypothetical protein
VEPWLSPCAAEEWGAACSFRANPRLARRRATPLALETIPVRLVAAIALGDASGAPTRPMSLRAGPARTAASIAASAPNCLD